MRRFAVESLCVLVLSLSPRLVSAALSLQIGPNNGSGIDAIPILPNPGQQFFDLIFNETGTAENEGLFAYDLVLNVVRPAGKTGGISLAGADRPPADFVLSDDPSKSTFSVANSTADNLLINVSSNNDLFDITQGKKAARIFYTIDPATFDANAGPYRIVFDTQNTVFGSGDPNRPDPAITVDLSDAGVVAAIPEPASVALLGFAGLAALKRRR